jgi:hypothetical protein
MFKKIILQKEESKTVILSDVCVDKPIFAKRRGKLSGMVVRDSKGWMLRLGGGMGCKVLRLGGGMGCKDYFETRQQLIKALSSEFEFFVED